MKHIINNAAQGTDLPWVTLDENGVHYPTVIEVSFTFGSVDSHTKAKADAVVGDICYYGETPIGVVVIKGSETVKMMSLFDLKENGTNSPDHYSSFIFWGIDGVETNVVDENNGKANTAELVALGSEYKSANACFLYSTEGTKQGDWYLPAKREWESTLWNTKNKNIINTSLISLGTMASSIGNTYYSTSTDIDRYANYGFNTTYYEDTCRDNNKTLGFSVRAFCEI